MRLKPEQRLNWSIPMMLAFVKAEDGQDLIEYALVAALVALGAVATIRSVSTKINSIFSGISTALTSAV